MSLDVTPKLVAPMKYLVVGSCGLSAQRKSRSCSKHFGGSVDIVLGVSMTPTTVRMVLVEGDKADGSIVDHDAFDVTANDGAATSSNAAEQVVEAILGTKESAAAGGHHLKSIGVTWSDHAEASTLREDRKSTRLNSSHLGISYAV